MNLIDLRSDTVTRPTPAMLDAMFHAQVGDDVYGEDPTVNALEQKTAALFGMEAGLFCPSGTMTNQIAIKVHTRPGDEVICAEKSHIYQYEGGGMASNSGVQAKLLMGDRGRINASQIAEVVNAVDVHFPTSRLVSLENTSNRGGGSVYALQDMKSIREVCDDNQMLLHLDGARIFNATVAAGYTPIEVGKIFHSISVCLSKGLGTPVGSVLLGTKEFIYKARRVRKSFGGGMRQAGYLAAAGIYALDHHINRLAEDHARAKTAGVLLGAVKGIQSIMPIETNIVIGEFETADITDQFVTHLKEHQILCGRISPTGIRFVFHLDIDEDGLNMLKQILSIC